MSASAVLRRAGGRRFDEQVVADRLQAGLVDEARERELAERRSAWSSPAAITDTWPCGLMVSAGRVLRDGDAGLHDVALRGDDAALRVHLERAVAGIGVGAVRQLRS